MVTKTCKKCGKKFLGDSPMKHMWAEHREVMEAASKKAGATIRKRNREKLRRGEKKEDTRQQFSDASKGAKRAPVVKPQAVPTVTSPEFADLIVYEIYAVRAGKKSKAEAYDVLESLLRGRLLP